MMNSTSISFCFLLVSLSLSSNSACKDSRKVPLNSRNPSSLKVVVSATDLTIEGPLREQVANISLEDSKKRPGRLLQSAPKRRSTDENSPE